MHTNVAEGSCCCYLLLSQNTRTGRTYCGVTNNLTRRLSQHNGRRSGGARYTRGAQWTPVCTVEGFTNRSQALSFEWWVKRRVGGLKDVARAVGWERRCQRMVRLLALDLWWKKRPPCPATLTLRWWRSIPPSVQAVPVPDNVRVVLPSDVDADTLLFQSVGDVLQFDSSTSGAIGECRTVFQNPT